MGEVENRTVSSGAYQGSKIDRANVTGAPTTRPPVPGTGLSEQVIGYVQVSRGRRDRTADSGSVLPNDDFSGPVRPASLKERCAAVSQQSVSLAVKRAGNVMGGIL